MLPFVVVGDLVIGPEIVPFAGHHHVVVTIEPHLAGTAGDPRGERGERRPLRRLCLLAAEGSAHAPRFDGDGRLRQLQHFRDDGLNFARMLGGRMHEDRVFARDGQCDLAFEIEMVLAADPERAGQAVRSRRERRRTVPLTERVVGHQAVFRRQRLIDRNQRRLGIDLDLRQLHGPASGGARFSDDRKQHLATELDGALRQNRIVALDRAAIIAAGHVGGCNHPHHAGRPYARRQVRAA